jgi:hypothetical protein
MANIVKQEQDQLCQAAWDVSLALIYLDLLPQSHGGRHAQISIQQCFHCLRKSRQFRLFDTVSLFTSCKMAPPAKWEARLGLRTLLSRHSSLPAGHPD